MPRIEDTTNQQTKFLRAFARNPAGPPAAEWPSAVVLQRWLRKPAFRARFDELRHAARFRIDAHFDAVSLRAASNLTSAEGSPASKRDDLELLRFVLRQRQ